MHDDVVEWQQWRDARSRGLLSVPGNLALVAYQGVDADAAEVEFLPGVTVRREPGTPGVLVSAPPGACVLLDGQPIDGEAFVGRLRPDGTPLLHAGRYWIDAFSLDGSDYELRIYDEQAANLTNFDGILYYDYEPALVVQGEFRAYESTDAVAWEFTRSSDTGHTKQVPGAFIVTLDGERHEMLAFLDGNELVLVFADATTGAESYAPGRFLRVPKPHDSDDLVVDFNRTFIPPCGFSDFYSCPIPPATNRLPVPIRGGEKRVAWKHPRY